MKTAAVGTLILVGLYLPMQTLIAGESNESHAVRSMESEAAAPLVQDQPAPVPQPPKSKLLSDMDFRRWPAGQFYESFNAQIRTLSTAHGPESREVFLDIAELYLSNGMLLEAQSVLEEKRPTERTSRPRWQMLNDAAQLLGGLGLSSTEPSPLFSENRPDAGLWRTLNAIALGDAATLKHATTDAVSGLVYQSRPVARQLLPVLTEAAIELGDLQLSETLLLLMNEIPDMNLSSTGHYLRGRHAERQNNTKTAVEQYFEAAKGWDRYAARARIALAGAAFEDGGRGALLAARDVLESGSDAWHGDEYGLQVLQRLAEAYSRLEEPVGALITYSKLLQRYPGTPEAQEAGKKASEDLAKVYDAGSAGDLDLVTWTAIHFDLVPSFRYFPDFAERNEQLADYAMKIGGTVLAASEYRRTLILLRNLRDLAGREIDDSRFDDVTFKLAKALTKGGQWPEALVTLDEIDLDAAPNLREAVSELKARILSGLGDSDMLLKTVVTSPDPDHLREYGKALIQRRKFPEAEQFFLRLWSQYPGNFSVEDATYLLISAFHSQDMATMKEVATAFPRLTSSQALSEIAASLLEEAPSLEPLRRGSADHRLDSLDRALAFLVETGL